MKFHSLGIGVHNIDNIVKSSKKNITYCSGVFLFTDLNVSFVGDSKALW